MIPQINKKGTAPHLIVDGSPFLILGLQWDCNSCWTQEAMGPLFKPVKDLGANTAALPVYWKEIEPKPGKYDFSMMDYRLKKARKNDLKLVLLWFGGYKNAECCYAPDYIRKDHKAYRKAHKADGTLQPVCLCPYGEAALERDKKAVQALMSYLRKEDKKQSVILFQPENEPGLMGTDRCYCPQCTDLFEKGKWKKRFGSFAAETFTADSIARYVDAVAGAAKKIYPIPMYINAWLGGGPASIPGKNYPSGGAVPHQLETWRKAVKHLDFIAPDVYSISLRDFTRYCTDYSAKNNPLYIAETSCDITGRSEKNVFYAIGKYGAIGFDPWAIDANCPHWNDPPLVNPLDGSWGPQAGALRDSYTVIRDAMPAITQSQGTKSLFTFVQEEGEPYGNGCTLDDIDFGIGYEDMDKKSRGMIIHLGGNDFLALGIGFHATPQTSSPECRPIPLLSLEQGRYEGNKWVTIRPVVRETAQGDRGFSIRKPGVYRFTLAINRK